MKDWKITSPRRHDLRGLLRAIPPRLDPDTRCGRRAGGGRSVPAAGRPGVSGWAGDPCCGCSTRRGSGHTQLRP